MEFNSQRTPRNNLFPLSDLTRYGARNFGDHIALRQWTNDAWRSITYVELNEMALAVARWLLKNGLRKGDRAAVLGENCPEWAIAYLGIHAAGAVVVPIDSQLNQSGISHILYDSEARFLFATHKFITSLNRIDDSSSLEFIVNLSAKDISDTISLEQTISEGKGLSEGLPVSRLDELASINYTSGTTGYSKGVMLSHRNLISNVVAANSLIKLGTDDTFLSVLPVHHALEGTAGFLLPLYAGSSITYARSMKSADLMSDIQQTNVTVMIGVPLLFEKMMAGILKGLKKKSVMKQSMFHTLMKVVKAGEKVGIDSGSLLFKQVRSQAGFGTVKYFISGGGPLDPQVGMFFNRLGIKLLQGYGLTETSPVTHVNPPNKIRMATVGRTLDGIECRIGEISENGVGEVEVKGPNVFMGYYKNETATHAVMTDDGWLKTGDLGVIDDQGYLTLMGRKKNVIVTGGGKNVYPEEIEFFLGRQPYIGDTLILGITRDSGYGEDVGALILPDQEQLEQLREERGGEPLTAEEISKLIQSAVENVSRELPDYKKIRKFRIMTEDFQKTSSKKIKRFLYSGSMIKG